MTQIFLVRHGQSEGNLFRRVQGQTDVELTADGKALASPSASDIVSALR